MFIYPGGEMDSLEYFEFFGGIFVCTSGFLDFDECDELIDDNECRANPC